MYLLQVRGVRPAELLQCGPRLRPESCDHNPQLKYVGDTGPDPEEEENGAGPRGQRGRRHQL